MTGPDTEKGPIIDESQYLELDRVDQNLVSEFLQSLGLAKQNLDHITLLLQAGWKIVAWLDHNSGDVFKKARQINLKYPGTTTKQQIEYGVWGHDGKSKGTVYLYKKLENPIARF